MLLLQLLPRRVSAGEVRAVWPLLAPPLLPDGEGRQKKEEEAEGFGQRFRWLRNSLLYCPAAWTRMQLGRPCAAPPCAATAGAGAARRCRLTFISWETGDRFGVCRCRGQEIKEAQGQEAQRQRLQGEGPQQGRGLCLPTLLSPAEAKHYNRLPCQPATASYSSEAPRRNV